MTSQPSTSKSTSAALPVRMKIVTELSLNKNGDVSLLLDHVFKPLDISYNIFKESLNKDKEKYYTKKYNSYRMYSWVITVDPYSYMTATDMQKKLFIDAIHLLLETISLKYEYFTLFQNSDIKGLHAHMSILTPNLLQQKYLDNINMLLQDFAVKYYLKYTIGYQESCFLAGHSQKNFLSEDVEQLLTYSSNFQKIKSTACYINYLKSQFKGTYYFSATSKELYNMFIHFNSDLLFPEGSQPKKLKVFDNGERSNSDSNVVNFMMSHLHKGISEYQDLLKIPAIQAYLHLPSLTSIWQNCYMQFAATNTLEKNWDHIFKNIGNLNSYCCCAIFDYLRWQNISLYQFCHDFIAFLFKTNPKKNVIYFQGIPNAGKSYFLRTFWELFLLHRRCTNEERFSFANLPGSGSILWDDPHISPDIVDMFKQLTEGENSMEVPVKGKASQIVNSTPRWFITANKPLSRYVIPEDAAIKARMYSYTCHRDFSESLCKANSHYCTRIESVYNTVQEASRIASQENFNEFIASVPSDDSCFGNHKITHDQALSFILFAAHQVGDVHKIAKSNYIEHIVKNRFNRFCQSSLDIYNNDDN